MTAAAGKRVLLFGASGTIGHAVALALLDDGHAVTCFLRPERTADAQTGGLGRAGAVCRFGDVTDPASIMRDAFAGEPFDAVVSCLASRNGVPADARAIDYQANSDILQAARANVVPQMVLLSAICVQKPRLAFQHAKLAFEAELRASGLAWSIVRPTAFFKSLSGQVERVRAGKPFMLFGDGELTRGKPISDRDCARFISACLTDPALQGRILPIGGPGPAITPREQGEMLFRLLGEPPRFRHVPLKAMDGIVAMLDSAARFSRRAAEKAEYARIGRYYASESMVVLNPLTGKYDADATPEFGEDTLESHYRELIAGAD
ncbi:NAD(P)H-binding protein [Aurantiacibacter odishensis]|uniref:NAD(P)H-binding protein n=1 Tax=Aurantiacibacter odishensis TaxID=1155476 RepID=UPI00196A27F3|nr:NAD(P)H-binding protein [Aurantiacibacter odishensis]